MPIPIIAEAFSRGFSSIPFLNTLLKVLPSIALIVMLKYYFGGALNTSERLMHSKVIMITGGTSGIGASIARHLASRGAQIIILSQHSPTDPFLGEYIDDLRKETSNDLIYAEQVDLASLHSIRCFATKWIDNAPPRRLDMVILCAATMTPRFSAPIYTQDGLEPCWGINYLANFHLLTILSPSLRAQPPDRDVRIVMATCASYVRGDLVAARNTESPFPKGREYETSKLALMILGSAFQKHLDAYERPDKQPNNSRVVLVDPGIARTPGMRRWLSLGSLWGLFFYLIAWPMWWLILKSPDMGAQGFLRASMEAELGRGVGARFLKECKEGKVKRKEFGDENIAKDLWQFSENQISALERKGAARRALARRDDEEQARKAGREDGPTGNAPFKTAATTTGAMIGKSGSKWNNNAMS